MRTTVILGPVLRIEGLPRFNRDVVSRLIPVLDAMSSDLEFRLWQLGWFAIFRQKTEDGIRGAVRVEYMEQWLIRELGLVKTDFDTYEFEGKRIPFNSLNHRVLGMRKLVIETLFTEPQDVYWGDWYLGSGVRGPEIANKLRRLLVMNLN